MRSRAILMVRAFILMYGRYVGRAGTGNVCKHTYPYPDGGRRGKAEPGSRTPVFASDVMDSTTGCGGCIHA